MGLYDREYIRVGPRSPSGFGSARVLSVNTWLIIINIAVFLLDLALFSSVGVMEVFYEDEFIGGATAEQQDRAEPVGEPRRSDRVPNGLEFTLVDPNTRQIVGERHVMMMSPLAALGHFSTYKALFELQVWRFITFQFLHADINHLFFNMLGLFFFGGLVENYLGRRRYLAFYLTTGCCGALLYLALNLLGFWFPGAPGVLFHQATTPLIGASAGVFGVLMAGAFIAPNALVLLFFILPMRLATLAYAATVIAAVVLITAGPNAGGEAAHLGGALSGFFLIRNTHVLRNIVSMFTFGGSGPAPGVRAGPRARAAPSREDVDRVLDKVRERGLHSLTDGERRVLRQATETAR